MFAGRYTSSAGNALAFIKYDFLASFQSAHRTGFNTANASSAAGTTGTFAIFPAAFLVVNLYCHFASNIFYKSRA
jgi:hypothetical protein